MANDGFIAVHQGRVLRLEVSVHSTRTRLDRCTTPLAPVTGARVGNGRLTVTAMESSEGGTARTPWTTPTQPKPASAPRRIAMLTARGPSDRGDVPAQADEPVTPSR